MARIIIPTQNHHIDPYQTRVFQWDTPQSDIFLSRIANSLLSAFGDDIVLRGLGLVQQPSYSSSADITNIVVDTGMMIQDLTLLEFPNQNTLTFENLSNFDTSGKLVVAVQFKWIHTLEENSAKLIVDYIADDGTSFYGWNHDTHRTILGIIEFEKTSGLVTSVFESDNTSITIEGEEYILYGYSDGFAGIKRYIIKIIEDTYINNSLQLIDEGDVPFYADQEYMVKVINGNLELHPYIDMDNLESTPTECLKVLDELPVDGGIWTTDNL